MKKILITIILSTLICVGAVSAYTNVVSGDTLSIIAKEFNMSLQELISFNPQIENPDLIYPGERINLDSGMLGSGGQPITDYESTLAQPISSSATTIYVASLETTDGHTITSADFAPAIYFMLDPNNDAKKEIAKCTTASSTLTAFTGCTRGLAFYGNVETTVTANQESHGAGVQIVNSNVHYYYVTLNNAQTWTDVQTYDQYPIASSSLGYATTSYQFVTLVQAQALTNQGAATSTYVIGGISRLGTQLETASSTYAVLDPTVVSTRYTTSTNGNIEMGWIPVTDNTGYLNQNWYDLTASWSFSDFTSASSTLNGNTLLGNATSTGALNVEGDFTNAIVPYYGNGSDGAKTVTASDFFPNSASSTLATLVATSSESIIATDSSQFATSTYIFIHAVRGTNVGNWEIKKVIAKNDGTNVITLDAPLNNSYQATAGANVTQILGVPQYTTVVFKGSGDIDPRQQWRYGDATLGGVVVFYASNGVIIEGGTTVSLEGFGFLGANTANDQGEGSAGDRGTNSVNPNGNGGGGGNTGTAVGQGGYNFVDASANWFAKNGANLLLGGGGGNGGNSSGDGGDGGGIFMPITPVFINHGTLRLEGADGTADEGGNTGGGGGGGGGIFYFLGEQSTVYSTTSPITLTGGNGGAGAGTGKGGGGGGEATTGSDGATTSGGKGGYGYIIKGWIEKILPSR